MDNAAILQQLLQQLTTILTLIVLGVASGVAATILAAVNAWVARKTGQKVDNNTKVTVEGNEAATASAEDAKKAANIAAEKAMSIEKKADKIEQQLNGGPEGLGHRVAKNELRLENLEKGQAESAKQIASVKEGLNAVASSVDKLVLNLARFSRQYEQNNLHEAVLGETILGEAIVPNHPT